MTDVLLVGSEKVFPPEMEQGIRGLGHSPARHHTAAHVLSSLAGNGDEPIVFLDAEASQYNSLELIRKVLVRRPQARVIMTATRPTVGQAVEAMRVGAWDFVPRPFSVEKLELLISQGTSPLGRERESSSRDGLSSEWTIITQDARFCHLLTIAERAAAGISSILIQGESGTGKEMLARFIHHRSPRKDKPFVALNCAALPETLLESELFGHEKGAFTGAVSRRLGKFELAHGGTLLLDEITEMDLHLQAKLLRVLQEQTIDRLGGQAPVKVDVRVIATTNRAVMNYIEEGKFREDLFYRLNVIPLVLPPLHERTGDIPLLIEHFVGKHSERNNKVINKISEKIHEVLSKRRWKGNVRELENVIERAVVLAPDDELLVEHLFLEETQNEHSEPNEKEEGSLESMVGQTVHEIEKRLILSTLQKLSENRTRAAEMLGISIRTLRNKLKEYEQHQ